AGDDPTDGSAGGRCKKSTDGHAARAGHGIAGATGGLSARATAEDSTGGQAARGTPSFALRSEDSASRLRRARPPLAGSPVSSTIRLVPTHPDTRSSMVVARQAVITEPYKTALREVTLPDPNPDQILLAAEYSAVSAGTELAVYTGTHQWLKDPNLPEWKFPFCSGYSAAGTVLEVGSAVKGCHPGDRVSYPGNHASAELLTIGHERGRLWKLPP